MLPDAPTVLRGLYGKERGNFEVKRQPFQERTLPFIDVPAMQEYVYRLTGSYLSRFTRSEGYHNITRNQCLARWSQSGYSSMCIVINIVLSTYPRLSYPALIPQLLSCLHTSIILHYLVPKAFLEPITPITGVVGAIWLVAYGIELDKGQASDAQVRDGLVGAVGWEPWNARWLVWRAGDGEIGDVALESGGDCGVDWDLDTEVLLVWLTWVVEGYMAVSDCAKERVS